jgi:hypothetical protein
MMRLTYFLAIEKIKNALLGKALLAAQSNDKNTCLQFSFEATAKAFTKPGSVLSRDRKSLA